MSIAALMAVIRAAIREVGAMRYALGVAGLIAVVGIVKALSIDFRVAVIGCLVLLILMVVLLLFARLEALKSQKLFFWPAAIFLWFSLILFMTVSVLFDGDGSTCLEESCL